MVFRHLILIGTTSLTFIASCIAQAQLLPPMVDQRPARLEQAQKAHNEMLAHSVWMDTSRSSDQRARAVLDEMTLTEKMRLLSGEFAAPMDALARNNLAIGSAGYVPGIPRLGIPALQETDGELGVTNPGWIDPHRSATVLPSTLAGAATWQPDLVFSGGSMMAAEAKHYGFNTLLAGTTGLVRDPRAGRAFEMPSEDPLLSGKMAAAKVKGIQSQHVLATVKHLAMNDQETGRNKLSAQISDGALHQSDLLSFMYAVRDGQPGAVMCSYNRINGQYACGNRYLLTDVLKKQWRYPGFVMSDWGAVYGTHYAKAGLDQESAAEAFDGINYFGAPLEKAVENGQISHQRLDDMAFRILRSYFATGLVDDHSKTEQVDFNAHRKTAQQIEENGIVLLRNEQQLLPLDSGHDKRIAVIGSYADRAVVAGGGSSTVDPVGGDAVSGLTPPKGINTQRIYPRSSPLKAIKAHMQGDQVEYADDGDIHKAVKAARNNDVAIVFANQWSAETIDQPTLSLGDYQNRLIQEVAKANPNTIVVLETGGAVSMPWKDQVKGIMEAWYPGQGGGEAIANVLFGAVNPAGRLPISFPRSEQQLPRPTIPGLDIGNSHFFNVDYNIEGADVGYRWHQRKHQTPLYPFGYGLSYTGFEQNGLSLQHKDKGIQATFTIQNTGKRSGRTVPQLYVNSPNDSPVRLGGWQSIDLAPGEKRTVSIYIEPHQLAYFDGKKQQWEIKRGTYEVSLRSDAEHVSDKTSIEMAGGKLNSI